MIYYLKTTYIGSLLNWVVAIGCAISFGFTLVNVNAPGYQFLPLLPFAYFLCYFLFLRKTVRRNLFIFNIVFIGISLFRYVILPFFIVYASYYGGRSPSPPSPSAINEALFLMIYELVAVSIAISYFDYKSRIKKVRIAGSNDYKMAKVKYGYWIFIALSFVLLAANQNSFSLLSFFVPQSLADVDFAQVPLFDLFCIYIFIIAKQLLFLIVLYRLALLYKKNGGRKYHYWGLVAIVFNMGLYFGTSRSDILTCAIASFFAYYIFFFSINKKLLIVGGICVAILINKVSEVRELASVSKDFSELIDVTDGMQIYVGGPYNVAMAIETEQQYPEASSAPVLFFDIFRPIIGVNIFIKDLPIQYSNIYYNRRYFLSAKRSQIIPMIGQGYLHFGFLFAPLFSVIFVWLAFYIKKVVNMNHSLELYYFLTLSVTRIGFFMGQNTMNMLNDMSYNLVLFLIIYYINKKFLVAKAQTA